MCHDIDQTYFRWLCDIVHIDQEDRSYWLVAKDLFRKTFFSLIEHDENRGYDGLELRDEFVCDCDDEYDMTDQDICEDCSVLEMMIALARRIDFETSNPYDDDGTDRTAFWFWEMMDNLGLTEYDDESYVELEGQTYVDSIIDEMVERKYRRNGDGGLFPLKKPRAEMLMKSVIKKLTCLI